MSLFNKTKKSDKEAKKAEETKKVEPAKVEIDESAQGGQETVKTDTKAPVKKGASSYIKNRQGQLTGILLRPIITETSAGLSQINKYAFEIDRNANKIQVAQAIESRYGIKPVRVNVLNMIGKKVRFGRTTGKRKDTKKAVVTLPKGKSIEIYEGV